VLGEGAKKEEEKKKKKKGRGVGLIVNSPPGIQDPITATRSLTPKN
jgi:hypothetical protein